MSSKHSGSEEGHQLSRQDSVIRSGILQANFRPVFLYLRAEGSGTWWGGTIKIQNV